MANIIGDLATVVSTGLLLAGCSCQEGSLPKRQFTVNPASSMSEIAGYMFDSKGVNPEMLDFKLNDSNGDRKYGAGETFLTDNRSSDNIVTYQILRDSLGNLSLKQIPRK